MRLIFIHGGLHTARCWDDTIGVISELRPDVTAVAVNLPGRQGILPDLPTLTIDQCATVIVRQITDGGGAAQPIPDETIVLVGHSLAGVLLSRVVERLWHTRPVRVVFVACCVPAPGQCVVDTLPKTLRPIVRHLARRSPVIDRLPPGMLRYAFGNHATTAQRALIGENIVSESSALLTEPVEISFPSSVHKSWVLTERDRALPTGRQRTFMRNAGGVDRVVTIDASHEVMLTHPHELAVTLLKLCTPG